MSAASQLQFSFDGAEPAPVSGVELWREERAAQLRALAAKLGLPMGQRVRIVLASGITLEGLLVLADEALWLPSPRPEVRLAIGRVDFCTGEIESCVLAQE